MIKQFPFKQFSLACHLFAYSFNGQTFLFDPGSGKNEGVLRIHKISRAEVSSSVSLMSHQGPSLVGSYPYTEIQLVYFTALADWAERGQDIIIL